MLFHIFAAKRVLSGVQNDRIDDLVSANLRGQKCPAVREFEVGKFHQPVPCNTPHPFIVHGTASQSLLRMLGFLEGRDGGGKLRGFFAHFSGKQFGQSSGVSECLHQELHPRELVFGVAGHLPDSTPTRPSFGFGVRGAVMVGSIRRNLLTVRRLSLFSS